MNSFQSAAIVISLFVGASVFAKASETYSEAAKDQPYLTGSEGIKLYGSLKIDNISEGTKFLFTTPSYIPANKSRAPLTVDADVKQIKFNSSCEIGSDNNAGRLRSYSSEYKVTAVTHPSVDHYRYEFDGKGGSFFLNCKGPSINDLDLYLRACGIVMTFQRPVEGRLIPAKDDSGVSK